MLIFNMLKIWIFLIVRKRDAQDIRLIDNLMEQCAAAEFDIVWMRAQKENSFTEEVHALMYPKLHTPEQETFRMP